MADEPFSVRRPVASSPEPAERVWNLIGSYGPDVAGLCQASATLVPGVSGIGLSAGAPLSVPHVRFSGDDTTALIEDFQHTLHEGPCRDAAATRQPVVAADLTTGTWQRRWPRFTPAALDAGVRAVFALPLHAGGVRHQGAVGLYRRSPGGLDGTERTAALVFAAAAAELLTLEALDLNLTDAFTDRRRDAGRGLDGATPVNAEPGPATNLPAVVLTNWFAVPALALVRGQVRAVCADHGLSGDDLYLFVVAVHEAMTNVARHGGGHGQLLLWSHAGHLWCEITDHGPGIPAACLARPPGTSPLARRGLWIIRCICTSCRVTTDATGTRLLLGYRLGHRLDH
jgi:anti-sigma regulatory factor (Ser/Thr protein kinase)